MAVAQPVQNVLAMTECAAKDMLEELGYQRQRGSLRSVEGFQIIWNSLLPDVRGVQGVSLPSQNNGQLVVDGLYGGQTASATNNFVQTPVPPRASEMPAWYAQNQGMVAAMCAPAPPIDPVPAMPQGPPVVVVPDQLALEAPAEVIPAPVPMAPAPLPPEAYVPPADMGPVIEAQMPQALPPAQVLPAPEPIMLVPDPEMIKEQLSAGPIVVESPRPPGLPEEIPAVRIYAKPRTADVPVYAIGLGVLAVGGITAYWYLRRKRKR